ncbi:MAG: hypothetical protein CMI54_00805 [Parcubacteria group bacterium]|nr:hypothetical protein [Parcubacteria group bacterium]
MKVKNLILLSSALLLSAQSFASSGDMRTYSFTSNFIDCVKKYKDQSDEYAQAGNSMSSLMNGRGVVSGGELDSSYWTYMNCLSSSASGTASTALPVGRTCSEVKIETSYGRLYIPPGVEGKRVGVSGNFWKCTSGSWVRDSGKVVVPGGDDITPPPQEESCDLETVEYKGCQFTLGSTSNGQTVSDNFGPYFGDLSSNVEGRYLAVCRNGHFESVEASCEPVSCNEGERVEWTGLNSYGDSALCSGEVDYDGVVQHAKSNIVYYKSEWMAKLHTKIIEGEATFVCKDNRWVKSTDRPSTCSVKSINELRCQSKTVGGEKLFYCQ